MEMHTKRKRVKLAKKKAVAKMKWTTEESRTFKSSTKLGFWCYNKGRFVVHVGSMQSQCSNLHQWPTSW